MSEEKLIDYNDLKVKHLSGEYMNLPSAPEPDDILYWCKSKKKKIFTTSDMIKMFGEEKLEQIEKTMEFLDFNNYIKIIDKAEIIDPKSNHWFYHPESDSYSPMTWEEYGKTMEGVEDLLHLGVAETEVETEAEKLHKIIQEGGETEDGSQTITKYELLKNG